MGKHILTLFLLIFAFSFSFSSLAFYDSAANVLQSGVPINNGDLNIRVYDAASGGSEICQQTFSSAINNGFWSVFVSNCDDQLFRGATYYKEYRVNNNLIEFGGGNRLAFVSSRGSIGISYAGSTVNIESSTQVTGDLDVTGSITGDISAAQINSGTLDVSRIPSLPASQIGSGTLDVSRGGTGSTTGSITGTGALTFTAGGSNQGIELRPSGTGGVAIGSATTASGEWSVAMNVNSVASGVGSVAMGSGSIASGDYSTATGIQTTAVGDVSFSAGQYSHARSHLTTAIGSRITVGTTDADAQFSLGIGLDNTARTITTPNVMAIMGGNVGIGTTSPSYKLDVSGDIRANAFYYSSDERLKENIRPLESTLDKINKINTKRFTFINNTEEKIGVMAQELEIIFPEFVFTNEEGIKSVDYPSLITPLIKALQEQQSQIDYLRKELEYIKNN